jgi:hypothetical protein
MKKLFLFGAIIIFSITACKKDKNTQISFSIKNMTTLINESSDFIKSASPGELKEYNETGKYMYFYLENGIEGIDEAYLYYQLDYGDCIFIDIMSNYLNKFDDAKKFMAMADSELGTADYYTLSYLIDSATVQEVKRATSDSIWNYADSAGVTAENINEIYGFYHYDKYYVLAGGYYDTTSYGFLSILEIGRYGDLKKGKSQPTTKKDQRNLTFRKPFRSS